MKFDFSYKFAFFILLWRFFLAVPPFLRLILNTTNANVVKFTLLQKKFHFILIHQGIISINYKNFQRLFLLFLKNAKFCDQNTYTRYKTRERLQIPFQKATMQGLHVHEISNR